MMESGSAQLDIQKTSTDIQNKQQQQTRNIQVLFRVRPLLKNETDFSWDVDEENGKIQLIPTYQKNNNSQSYTFNKIYGEYSTNVDVFTGSIQPVLPQLLENQNCTVMCYGQSSSGKTSTMFKGPNDSKGLVQLIVDELFEIVKDTTFMIKLQYLEIYGDDIIDLLSTNRQKLTPRDEGGQTILTNVTEPHLTNHEQLMEYIQKGNKRRAVSKTNLNEQSSRSHAIIKLILQQGEQLHLPTKKGIKVKQSSCFTLVDLAGSERTGKSNTQGKNFQESNDINKSLTALGNVIQQLSTNRSYISYRDNKLTHLLQNSLGGNSVTFIIGCISPASRNIEESTSTIRFCQQAMAIKNKVAKSLIRPTQNVVSAAQRQEDLIIQNRVLKQRIQELEKQLSLTQSQCMVQSTCSSFISDNGELNINELDQYLNEQQNDVRTEKEVQTDVQMQIPAKEIIDEEDIIPDGAKLFSNEEFEQLKTEKEELHNQLLQFKNENEELKKKNSENELNAFQNLKKVEQMQILQQQEEESRNKIIQQLQDAEKVLIEKEKQTQELESEKHRLDNLLEELIKQTGDSSEQTVQYQEKIKEYENMLAQKTKDYEELMMQVDAAKINYDEQLKEAQNHVTDMQNKIETMENQLQSKIEQEAFFTQLLQETEASQKDLQEQLNDKIQNSEQLNANVIELQTKYAELQEIVQAKEQELQQQINQNITQETTLKDEVQNIKQEQTLKEQEIAGLQQQVQAYQDEIQKHGLTINSQIQEINMLQTNLEQKQTKIDQLQSILEKLQAEILEKQQNIADKSVQLSAILMCSQALGTSHAQLLSKCLQNSVIYGCDVSIQKSIVKYNKNINTRQQQEQQQDYNAVNNEDTGTLSKLSSTKISLKSQFSSINEVGEAISIQNASLSNSLKSNNSISRKSPLQQVYVNVNNEDQNLEESLIKFKASLSGDLTRINGYTTRVKESLTMKDLTRSNSGESAAQSTTQPQKEDNTNMSSATFVLQSNNKNEDQNLASTTNISAATTQLPSTYVETNNQCQSTHLLCAKSTVIQSNGQTKVVETRGIRNAKSNMAQASAVLKMDAFVQKTQVKQEDQSTSGVFIEEKGCQRTPIAQKTVSNQTKGFQSDKEQYMTPKICIPCEIQTDQQNTQNEAQTSPKKSMESVAIELQTSPLNKENFNQTSPLAIEMHDDEVQLMVYAENEMQTDAINIEMCDNSCQNVLEFVENNAQVTPTVIQDQMTSITPVACLDQGMQCCSEGDGEDEIAVQTEEIQLKPIDMPIDEHLKSVLENISSSLSTFSAKTKRPGLLKGKKDDNQSSVTSYNFSQLVKTLNKLIDVFAQEEQRKENERAETEFQAKILDLESKIAELEETNAKLQRKDQLQQQELEKVEESYKKQLLVKDQLISEQTMQLQEHKSANELLTKNIDNLMQKLHQEEEKTQRMQESALEEQLEMTQKILSITNGHSEHDSSETELVYSTSSQKEDQIDYKKLYEETEAKFNRLLLQSRETIQKVMTVAKERETNLQRKAAEQVQNMQKYKEIVMRMQMRAKQQQQTMQFQQQLIDSQINGKGANEVVHCNVQQ